LSAFSVPVTLSPCHLVTLSPRHTPLDAPPPRGYRPRMEMVLPDILGDLRQLSAVFSVAGLLIGLVLWLAGGWTHRFWVVLSLTVLGGIWGLNHAADLRAAPLFAAIGVGLATGLLALTVIRLGAFFAGGVAALVLVQAWSPSWDQPLVSFLAGGLAGWF